MKIATILIAIEGVQFQKRVTAVELAKILPVLKKAKTWYAVNYEPWEPEPAIQLRVVQPSVK